jgi:signal transduction histidine kinase
LPRRWRIRRNVDPDLVPKTSDLGITDPKRGGTGLGLPIVKTIAETHDGRIEVKRSMGEGTTMSSYLACVDELILLSRKAVRVRSSALSR